MRVLCEMCVIAYNEIKKSLVFVEVKLTKMQLRPLSFQIINKYWKCVEMKRKQPEEEEEEETQQKAEKHWMDFDILMDTPQGAVPRIPSQNSL